MTALKQLALVVAFVVALLAYVLFMPALVVAVIVVMICYGLAGLPSFVLRLPTRLAAYLDRRA